MAQLLVRNLDEDVKERLREKARRYGVSLEEQARTILSAAAFAPEPKEGLGTRAAALFKDCGLRPGEELERPDWDSWKPLSFDNIDVEE